MPTFTIQAPDGRHIDIQAPDQATAMQGAQQWAAANPAGRSNAPDVSGGSGATMRPAQDPISAGFHNMVGDAGRGWNTAAAQFGSDLHQMGANKGQLAIDALNVPFSAAAAGAGSLFRGMFPSNAYNDQIAANAGNIPMDRRFVTGQQKRDLAGALATSLAPVDAPVQAAVRGGRALAGALRGVPEAGDAGVRMFSQRARPNLQQMQDRASEYRTSGIAPTLTDVTDESGRGMVRAAASRMTPGRQAAQDFGDRRTLDLPDRIGAQARRTMSSDPRTPQQIADALSANRKEMGDRQYGAVRNEPFAMPDRTVTALRTDHGRDAIREAVRRERDPEVRAALNRLAGDALDAPNTPITVGMADGIAKVLKGRARAAGVAGDNAQASFLNGLAEDVRTPAMQAHPGYGDAVGNFATESSAIDATRRGEDFLKRNTDEFVSDVSNMSPDEVDLARASGRRAVERAAGESVGAAPGVARRLAEAPEQRARNAALLGSDAPAFEQGMRLEERAVQNAKDIAPRTGSQTFSRAQDAMDTASSGVKLAGKVARGDVIGSAFDAANMWLKSRGLNDAQAESLVRMATDPAQTDAVMGQLQAVVGQQPARQFIERFRDGLIQERGAGRGQALANALRAGAGQSVARQYPPGKPND